MILTDTHTHLYLEEFDTDRSALMEDATKLGVRRYYLPNIDSSSIERMLKLETNYPEQCFAMMGLHPCSVKENWQEEMEIVRQWLSKRRFAAIGEIGIDLYWDKTFLEEQKRVFKLQVELGNQYKLPVVIHSRESFDVLIELLKQTKKQEPCGIFHCFTGSYEQAMQVIGLGFYIGIGGVVTFKKSGLDQTIATIPLEHIVLETDAPYLAPAPFRGKRNLPGYLRIIAEKISEIKKVPLEEVARITSENASKLFNHGAPNPA